MRLLRLATAMTWDAGMLHQTTYNIVSVESAHVYLDDALSTRARESIRRIVGAYFTTMTSASFHFGRAGGDYRCTFTKQSAGLRTKSGEACNEDFCAAFDVALARVAKQLRRPSGRCVRINPFAPVRT